jgi:hypothetical protein
LRENNFPFHDWIKKFVKQKTQTPTSTQQGTREYALRNE